MSNFPTTFPFAEAMQLINTVRSKEVVPKEQLVYSAWIVLGYILGQFSGTPTLSIGKQQLTDPVAALEAAAKHAKSDALIAQANIPWAIIVAWLLDMLKLALKDRV